MIKKVPSIENIIHQELSNEEQMRSTRGRNRKEDVVLKSVEIFFSILRS